MSHSLFSSAIAVATAIALASGAQTARAVIMHDESVHGDISNDRLNPTHHTLLLNANSLIATSIAGDREYIRLSVPAGLSLSAINVVSWQSVDLLGFIGVQSGTTFTEPPTGTNVANILGYGHFGPGAGNVGLDILPEISAGPGAIGFTPPLVAGEYTFWIQQTGPDPATYQLDFITTPEPSALCLLLFGAATLLRDRRR